MINQKILEIFSDILDVSYNKLNLNTEPSDIDKWDSVAMINIIVAIEQEYNIKFKLKDLDNVTRINDFIELVKKYKK